jgi:hypothetical protein
MYGLRRDGIVVLLLSRSADLSDARGGPWVRSTSGPDLPILTAFAQCVEDELEAELELALEAGSGPRGVLGYLEGMRKLEPLPVNVRIKISALWTTMLLVFAYVDIFSLYRPDVRGDLETGEVGGFAVGQPFLLATTIYVVIPALMVFGALVLRPRINRIANIALSVIYALTIVAAAIGEWNTTCYAARSRSPCSRPLPTTRGPGRGRTVVRSSGVPADEAAPPPSCSLSS